MLRDFSMCFEMELKCFAAFKTLDATKVAFQMFSKSSIIFREHPVVAGAFVQEYYERLSLV